MKLSKQFKIPKPFNFLRFKTGEGAFDIGAFDESEFAEFFTEYTQECFANYMKRKSALDKENL